MATKKATHEELLAQFDDLGTDDTPEQPPPAAEPRAPGDTDDLAELENLAKERPKSRAHTPRVGGSPAKSAEPPRKSTDSAQRPATAAAAAAAAAPADEPASGGGWWGALSGAANLAVKQAEALAKEIQKSEDAQRWAEQVKGNMGALRSYGGELRSKAMPTFTTLLHTLAPPISAHERLQIHCTHDLTGYPSLDPLIHATFARVMAQVEGGELLILQRGQEAGPRRGSEAGYTGGSGGWSDGPWWKSVGEKRDLGAVRGMVEGTKLARVSAESYAQDFFAGRGGVEAAAEQATATLNESNPTRTSDIFLAIQAIVHPADKDHFAEDTAVVEAEDLVTFAIYLHDPIHSITFSGLSQSIPHKWTAWLDTLTPSADGRLPEDIREMVESGGLDPREWVAEWVEEVLGLGIGVVAQKYVARRMGVGEGFGKGKAREAPVEAGAGELARAM